MIKDSFSCLTFSSSLLEFTKSLPILEVVLENSSSKTSSLNSKGLKGVMDHTKEINPKKKSVPASIPIEK
jgi:hypothetical protein